ncbi:MAG TPA: hypothetical protein VKH37_13655, partial [Ferruginibacter sp.]|nr:hypothetical protein [Ferruginibacter sp.]
QISLQKPDTTAALNYFAKSLKYNENNIPYKNKAFLAMADIAFARRHYRAAAALYDSLDLNSDTTMAENKDRVETRRAALTKIVEAITNIEREDSLQRIAGMSEAERVDYVKKILRKLRKEQGLKEDNSVNNGSISINPLSPNRQPQELFPSSSTKGEWYFSNPSLKSKGYGEFKSRWGNRANVDNWRRVAAPVNANNGNVKTPGGSDVKGKGDNKNNGNANSGQPSGAELTMEELMKDIPSTPEKMMASNESVANNMLALAKLYQNELEEYDLAIETYEQYLKRFPDRLMNGEVYFGLYYCYKKLGNQAKADYYKGLLNGKFANTPSAKLLNNAMPEANAKNPEATKLYDQIYGLFIEGRFDQALAEKKSADSIYGVNYWTPQLMYIEALYHVNKREDSVAIAGLQNLVSFYPNSPLKEKAENVISVLRRRTEIETYLTNLQITRDTETVIKAPVENKPVVNRPPTNPVVKGDSTRKVPPPVSNGTFTMNTNAPHFVIMILDKVDKMYVNEAKNALVRYNKDYYFGEPIVVNQDALDADRSLMIISSFADADAALKYYDKIRRDAKNEISWLPPAKYSFLIITEANLQVLKTNKDVQGYKTLLNTQFPNRF